MTAKQRTQRKCRQLRVISLSKMKSPVLTTDRTHMPLVLCKMSLIPNACKNSSLKGLIEVSNVFHGCSLPYTNNSFKQYIPPADFVKLS